MMNTPVISIVIPCRNEKNYIIPCIQSVLHNNYPREKIEVIVCDGKSDDGTFELLKNYSEKNSQLKVFVNEKQTTPFALNLGIKNATGSIIIILGAHAEMHGNYLNTCVNILKENPDVWCCGGVLQNEAKDNVAEIISLAMTSPFGVGNAHFRTGAKDGYVDTVAFGAYRKEVFSLIGLFDEELTRNQDDEFNYRLTKAGKKIWLATDTSVKYFVRGSWKKLWVQYFQYGYWKVFVNRKHKMVTTFRQLIPFFFVLFLIAGIILSCFSVSFLIPFLIILSAYLMGAFVFAARLKNSIGSVIKIAFAFFILHLSYGTGYLKGVIDFILLRKKSASAHETLSR